jgi:hypothetical protein
MPPVPPCHHPHLPPLSAPLPLPGPLSLRASAVYLRPTGQLINRSTHACQSQRLRRLLPHILPIRPARYSLFSLSARPPPPEAATRHPKTLPLPGPPSLWSTKPPVLMPSEPPPAHRPTDQPINSAPSSLPLWATVDHDSLRLWIITIRFVDDHHPFCGSSPSVSWITIRFVDHHHLVDHDSVLWITIRFVDYHLFTVCQSQRLPLSLLSTSG